MIKNRYLLLLLLMFIPFFVYAEPNENVVVSSIKVEDQSGYVTVDNNTTNNNINVSMNEVGDTIKYGITIKNNADNDYEFDENSFNINSPYIDYSFELEDGTNILKANSTKKLYIIIKYKTQVPENEFQQNVYTDSITLNLQMLAKEKIEVIDVTSEPVQDNTNTNTTNTNNTSIKVNNNSSKAINNQENHIEKQVNLINNPETSTQSYIFIVIIVMVASAISCIIFKHKIDSTFIIILISTMVVIPLSVYALTNCTLEITINVDIKKPIPVTNKIYWALQNNDSDYINETLVIADHEVNGARKGSFAGDTDFDDYLEVPWIGAEIEEVSNLSYNVNNIVIDGVVAPQSTSYWFSGVGYNSSTMNTNLKDLIVDNVTDMSYMFMTFGSKVESLNLDLNSWDTVRVTNMSNLFLGFGNNSKTISLSINNWNTSNVTDMSYMFNNFGSNTKSLNLDISNFNTMNVNNMRSMFLNTGYFSNSLNLTIGDWNTSKVSDMSSMFSNIGYSANNCVISDISGFDTSKVTNMNNMFSKTCFSANTLKLDLSKWNVSKVTDFSNIFYASGYHTSTWEIGDLSKWNTSSATNMSSMFEKSGFDSTIWNVGDISGWNTSNVTDMSYLFKNVANNVDKFVLDLKNWDTGKVTNMYYMFYAFCGGSSECKLENISNWNTSNVTNMSFTFNSIAFNAESFKLDISNWNMSKVNNIKEFIRSAGYNASNWEIIIPKTNSNGINNTESKLYGSAESISINSSSAKIGRLFTVAQ